MIPDKPIRQRRAAGAGSAGGWEARLAKIDLRIEKIDGRLTLVMWQLAILIGGVATLVVKTFA